MLDFDRGAKIVLQRRHRELLQAIRPELRDPRPLEKEVVAAQATADGVYTDTDPAGRPVVHQVEFLAEPGSHGPDLLRRAHALAAVYGRPVRITCVYMHPAKDGREPPRSHPAELGEARQDVELHVVCLWRDFDAEVTLTDARLGLLPFVGLMAGGSLRRVARAAATIRRLAADMAEEDALLAALYLLSGHRFTDDQVRGILNEEQLMQSQTYNAMIARARRRDVERVLRARFVVLPEALVARLEAVEDGDLLDRLIDEAARAESVEAFTKALPVA